MRQKVAWYFTALEYLLLFLAFVLAVSPILLVITNSIKTGAETYKVPPSLIFAPTLNNYKYLLENDNFGTYFLNSLIVAISSTAIVITCGTLAAYGLRLMTTGIGRKISNLLLVGQNRADDHDSDPAVCDLQPDRNDRNQSRRNSCACGRRPCRSSHG